jgi:DNA-binding XRE family transcriptional regulator
MDDRLIIAAIDRAERHGDRTYAPKFVILEHLDVTPRSHAAREVNERLVALTVAGHVKPGREQGLDVFSLTVAARQRLTSDAQLPESPQHRQWRTWCTAAEANGPRFRAELEDALRDGLALLATGAPAHSDIWHTLGQHLERACTRVCATVYCLGEWAEPSDERRDAPNRGRAGHVFDPSGCESAALVALGRTVRQLREQQNMTKAALADAAGITPGRLTAIEAAKLDPRWDVLLALADGLSVPCAQLVANIDANASATR